MLCVYHNLHTPRHSSIGKYCTADDLLFISSIVFLDLPLCDLAPDLEGEVLVVPLQDVSLLPEPKSRSIRTTTKKSSLCYIGSGSTVHGSSYFH
jgi:hypothetical protein